MAHYTFCILFSILFCSMHGILYCTTHIIDVVCGMNIQFDSIIRCILYIILRIFGMAYYYTTHTLLKGSYDAISSFLFSLECYKLFVHR